MPQPVFREGALSAGENLTRRFRNQEWKLNHPAFRKPTHTIINKGSNHGDQEYVAHLALHSAGEG